MSRWLPTTALVAVLVLSFLAGCGSSPSSGGGTHTGPAGSTSTRPGESGKSTAKGADEHHSPG
jgi:hypothetical protein